MRGNMIMADHASAHPDGTISMLRAGINTISIKQPRTVFRGYLVVRLVGGPDDAGAHDVDIRCVGADGKPVVPVVAGAIPIPPGGGTANVVMEVNVAFQGLERVEWKLQVDGALLDVLQVDVVDGNTNV